MYMFMGNGTVRGRAWYKLVDAPVLTKTPRQGFVLLAAYLAGTWMFRLMPSSYYSWEGGVSVAHLAMQLLVNDFLQTAMHLGVHPLPRPNTTCMYIRNIYVYVYIYIYMYRYIYIDI